MSDTLFQDSPNLYIENAVKEFVAGPANRLTGFDNSPIFEEPLIGFADGDDPLFQEYKTIIGDFHLTPREVLEVNCGRGDKWKQPQHVSVISYVLPVKAETRMGMRKETAVPTLRWNHTRWQGQDLINSMARHLTALLGKQGYQAVAPDLTESFRLIRLEEGLASTWSQRHIAYAAGLGTFSLNDGLITEKGICMRCGSIVTDVQLKPTPRTYEHYRSKCLFYRDGSCKRCADRCPAGAITEKGHDKNKCRRYLDVDQKELLIRQGKYEGFIGSYVGCGLCQTKVPCESMIPPVKPENH
jgi:epoxyqueuosine reductase QueG